MTASNKDLRLRIMVEVSNASLQKVDEMRSSLQDLDLDDEIDMR